VQVWWLQVSNHTAEENEGEEGAGLALSMCHMRQCLSIPATLTHTHAHTHSVDVPLRRYMLAALRCAHSQYQSAQVHPD
jgi:hypothetical protein